MSSPTLLPLPFPRRVHSTLSFPDSTKIAVEQHVLLFNRRVAIQGGAGGLAVGWVDLDLECSTILFGQ